MNTVELTLHLIQCLFLINFFLVLFQNDLDVIASEANDKHSIPWAEACAKSNVHNTPLSPFIHKDHLTGYRIQMNGNKLINSSGFTLKHPIITAELLKQVCINCNFIKQKHDIFSSNIIFVCRSLTISLR